MKIVDDAGNDLPRDGKAFGDLLVRGPWITSGYFKGEGGDVAAATDGWFPTGDVATIDPDGYMQITDRVEGRDQVGRRMDQLDRSRERRDGASRGRRGGRDRRRRIRNGTSGRC